MFLSFETHLPTMLIGYARVSTDDQDSALQRDALTNAGCEKIFDETMSGARADRPQLRAALGFARKDDVLVVWKLDRLGRKAILFLEGRIEVGATIFSWSKGEKALPRTAWDARLETQVHFVITTSLGHKKGGD